MLHAQLCSDEAQRHPKITTIKTQCHTSTVVLFAGQEFLESLQYVSKVWLPAKQVVAAAIAERFQVDPSGQVITFKQVGCWGAAAVPVVFTMQHAPCVSLYRRFGAGVGGGGCDVCHCGVLCSRPVRLAGELILVQMVWLCH